MSRIEGVRGLASNEDNKDTSTGQLKDYIKKSKERLITTASSSIDNVKTNRIVVYPHHNHNDISIQQYMYKFKYRETHNTLTGELTVVQGQTFINFFTSEFRSSTRGERDTILKSLSWLSYPLRPSVNWAQCLRTWTKSRIVQSPTKLNDKT